MTDTTQTVTAHHREPRSTLKRRFIVPLLVGAVLVGLLGAWATYTAALAQMKSEFVQRGEILATAMVAIAETVEGSYQGNVAELRLAINDFVTLEPNVLSAMVASKDPFLIRAASVHAGATPQVANAPSARAIREAVSTGRFGNFFGEHGELTVIKPIRASDLELGSRLSPRSETRQPDGSLTRQFDPAQYRGAIMLRLDWASVRDASGVVLWESVAVTLAAVVVLMLIALFLLSRTVLAPVASIGTTIEALDVGHRDARVPALVCDEIGHVAEVLNELLDRVDEHIKERERYEETLEDRVAERTAALRRAQDELVKGERLATIGQLTATVSHELRNPLGTLRNNLSVLDRHLDSSDPRLRSLFERTDRALLRCDAIVAELLDFTRRSELDKRRLGFDDWLSSLLDEYAVPEGQTLERELESDNVEVYLDPERGRRVVVNLLDNAFSAVKEMKNKGRVTVRTRREESAVLFEIADTGPGIEAENLDQVFEPLFSTKASGFGLGLPNVKRIVEMHGGQIALSSALGVGTCVTISLPI